MAARAHGLTEMTEFLEQELQDSTEFDHCQIMDEAAQYETRAKALMPLRPLKTAADQESALSCQWPMVNLRAKEAERAATMFEK